MDVQWQTCLNSFEEYHSKDTICLFSNPWYYLSCDNCFKKSWNFSEQNSIYISETNICEELPVTWVLPQRMEFNFSMDGQKVFLEINENEKLVEKFEIVNLEFFNFRETQFTYKITLVRS